MHEKINTSQDEVEKIDRKLVDLYNKLTDRVSDCDSYLLSAPLHRLKAKGLVYKKEWIQQAKTALAALTERLGQGDNVHTGRQQQIAELQERRNRRQRMLGQMQSTMRAWLGRAGQNRQCQGNETGFSPTPAGNGRQRN
jgi:t-SNARE complex subunit (syntaxin)